MAAVKTSTPLCGTRVGLSVDGLGRPRRRSALTLGFFLPTANPLAQNPHLSHASQNFLLPTLTTSADTDSPQPLSLALKTSLAFIFRSLSLLVFLWFSQRWQQRQLHDEAVVRVADGSVRRAEERSPVMHPVSCMVLAEQGSQTVLSV